jgi:hypothetical protein
MAIEDFTTSPIYKIVFLYHFIKNTGIMPKYLAGNGSSLLMNRESYGGNRHLAAMILMLNFVYKVAFSIYRFQKQIVMNGKYRYINKKTWRNKYPIVLVHGYMGSAQD